MERAIMAHREIQFVHPATQSWLTEHGYTWKQEVTLPDFGRVDFVATDANGHILVVECKTDCAALSRTITQVRDYAQQFDVDVQCAIAVPQNTIADKDVALCERRQIKLIGLDVVCAAINDDTQSTWARKHDQYASDLSFQMQELWTTWQVRPFEAIEHAMCLYAIYDVSDDHALRACMLCMESLDEDVTTREHPEIVNDPIAAMRYFMAHHLARGVPIDEIRARAYSTAIKFFSDLSGGHNG